VTSSINSGSYTSSTTSTSSIGGLISGMDTTSVISQLMQIEAQPQTLLKNQLAGVQTDAAAYRDVNTAFAALQTAASALTGSSLQSVFKAASNEGTVTATAGAGATAGSLSFTVKQLSSTHALISSTAVGSLTAGANLGTSLSLTTGGTTTSIAITDSTGTGNPSLNDVVAAINKSSSGLKATTISTGSGYLLQVTAAGSGAAKAFTLTPAAGATNGLSILTQGQDAQIVLGAGGPTPTTINSATNTFSGVLAGTSFTVSQAGATPTLTVSTDTAAITSKVQALVTAANNVLTKIGGYTDSSSGSTAPLKSDWSLISLSGQIVDAVTNAVGTASAASAGLAVDRYGAIQFDATAFTAKLTSDPTFVTTVFAGSTGVGKDNIKNTPDDTLDVDGLGARLMQLADRASDSATGILTSLAKGEDTRAKDLQSQIDDWTLRLQSRQQALTDQFNAMETALGTLKNQSSWLTSQINALPSWSSSSKS
jgi:flagellar hook-associated protein 2